MRFAVEVFTDLGREIIYVWSQNCMNVLFKISCAGWGELLANPLARDSIQWPTQGLFRMLQGMEDICKGLADTTHVLL